MGEGEDREGEGGGREGELEGRPGKGNHTLARTTCMAWNGNGTHKCQCRNQNVD